MKTIKLGIIGVGLIGKSHLEIYREIEGAEVIAVCDINVEEARKVAEQYDVPHVFSDFRDLLEREEIDAVDICLHNNLHSAFTIESLKKGKHVYCEKPIAGTYFDGQAMVEAAKDYDRLLHIQLGSLYRLDTKAARALIDDGQLGNIYHARSTGFRRRGRPYVDGYGTKAFTRKESAGGGALLDMGVYHLAQILYLLDLPKVKTVSGKLYQEMAMDAGRRAESGFDVEEFSTGFVRMEGGLTLDIIEAWSVHLGKLEGSSILGSNGGIQLHPYSDKSPDSKFSFHTTIADIDFDSTTDLGQMNVRRHRLYENEDAYNSSQHHWIAALQERVPLLPTAEIALLTMLISEGIYLSDQLEREVTADEIMAKSKSAAISII